MGKKGKGGGGARRYAIVASRFNPEVADRLLAGARSAFRRRGIPARAVDVVRVPGAFEIPMAARALAATGRYAAIAALGCVIRGETDHYGHVAREAIAGVRAASEATGVPVTLGILTCDTDEQAMARAGGRMGNKGAEAAEAAIEMAGLLRGIRG